MNMETEIQKNVENDKKIAVIGGGFCGILAIAELKEEGFNPICFEKTDQTGGTWCYREESVDGIASIMPTTIINHSKELGALSNYPPKKELSNYMKHNQLYQYIQDFVDDRDVRRHIRLNTEVLECKRAKDYDETGRWSVNVRDSLTGEESSDIYDGVLTCVGHINRPKFAKYPLQETFKGKIMHTHGLKGVSGFKEQNVVVVGMGCSALDAAVEISSVAKQVYLSTRSGAHVINRVGPGGKPIDYVLLRRYLTRLQEIAPDWLASWYFRKFYLDPGFSYKLYSVEPKYDLFARDPVLNDHIGSKLLSGQVVQKKDINTFIENGVIFEGDENETEVDVVIMATGYDWKFPFLEEGIVKQEENFQINLYKTIWPPQLKHPTFAVLGFLLPFGPGFPIWELQCRWAAYILAGKGTLPSEKKMMKDIEKRHKYNMKRYTFSEKTTLRVDSVPYMDELASLMGVKPNFFKMFFTDLRLFYKLWFGPCVSYQYRLKGPHKWDGARKAILSVDERVFYPLQKEKQKKKKTEHKSSVINSDTNQVP